MKNRLSLLSFLLVTVVSVGGLARIAFYPVHAQTPPVGLLFELPMIDIHGSVPRATGGYDSVPLMIDVDANGYADIVMSDYSPVHQTWTQYVYLNNGNGWDKVYQCSRTREGVWSGDCDDRN